MGVFYINLGTRSILIKCYSCLLWHIILLCWQLFKSGISSWTDELFLPLFAMYASNGFTSSLRHCYFAGEKLTKCKNSGSPWDSCQVDINLVFYHQAWDVIVQLLVNHLTALSPCPQFFLIIRILCPVTKGLLDSHIHTVHTPPIIYSPGNLITKCKLG